MIIERRLSDQLGLHYKNEIFEGGGKGKVKNKKQK